MRESLLIFLLASISLGWGFEFWTRVVLLINTAKKTSLTSWGGGAARNAADFHLAKRMFKTLIQMSASLAEACDVRQCPPLPQPKSDPLAWKKLAADSKECKHC